MNQGLARLRDLEQRIGARRHFAEPRADDEQQVRLFHALRELRIKADADIARIARAAVVEQILAAKRSAGGQARGLGPLLQLEAGLAVPAAAADDDERLRRFFKKFLQL